MEMIFICLVCVRVRGCVLVVWVQMLNLLCNVLWLFLFVCVAVNELVGMAATVDLYQ